MRVRGLDPLVGHAPRVLILGSIPGVRSLREKRYYVGHGNRFWHVMAALLDVPPTREYEARVRHLTASGVALWDVIESCERAGSLDAAIVGGSERANDVGAFVVRHPTVRAIALNGAKAADSFRRWVEPFVSAPLPPSLRLPSTSGANARFSRRALVEEWSRLGPYLVAR